MFGSAPRHGDQTGFQNYQWENNNPQDNTQFLLDKINELDKRLTNQMTCTHGDFSYKFINGMGPVGYQKTCGHCGLNLGNISHQKKLEEELEFHRSQVDRISEALKSNFPKYSEDGCQQ